MKIITLSSILITTLAFSLGGLAIAQAPLANVSEAALASLGFENEVSGNIPAGWQFHASDGAKGSAVIVKDKARSGSQSLLLSCNLTGKPTCWAGVSTSKPIPVNGTTSLKWSLAVAGKNMGHCFFDIIAQPSKTEFRTYMPAGTYDWQTVSDQVALPVGTQSIKIMLAMDTDSEAIWVDDLLLTPFTDPYANLDANWEASPFPTVYPKPEKPPAQELAVFMSYNKSWEERLTAVTLQGIINRKEPRIYLLNTQQKDPMWLDWLIERGYTGQPRTIATLGELVARFKDEISGAILYDPALPGSINAATMLAGLKGAVVCTPAFAAQNNLPVIEDFRGRWSRNIEAYRYAWENYYPKMNHHILALHYPKMEFLAPLDYMIQNNVFTFWVSGRKDETPGKDAEAEREFMREVLAKTPPNIPILGWMGHGASEGLDEYDGVQLASSFAKLYSCTNFSSNLSVHSAVRVAPETFRQSWLKKRPPVAVEPDKLYIALDIVDSGDAIWYWQDHQHKVWSDPKRGTTPVGWCLTPCLLDISPAILEWYYRHATVNDSFFAAMSGIGYMQPEHWGSRYKEADRAKAKQDYVAKTRDYCRSLDIDIVIYNAGGWSAKSPRVLQEYRDFFQGFPEMRCMLSDFGRHDNISAKNAIDVVDGKPVFHTLMRWRTMRTNENIDDEKGNIDFGVQEAVAQAPKERPAVMAGMMLSWSMLPTQIEAVAKALPKDYVPVLPQELPGIWQTIQNRKKATP